MRTLVRKHIKNTLLFPDSPIFFTTWSRTSGLRINIADFSRAV
jgi:hypothetical protein